MPRVQYIQKVQQSTEVSQQQYQNIAVPAEMQCQNTATQTLQKTDEAQQVPFPERSDQNIVKDAQPQRQVQMIQKVSSEIHSEVQNMLMPGSSETAVQARSSVADLVPTTDGLEMRVRTRREGEKGSMKAPHKALSRTQRCGDASTAVQETQQRTTAQQCKRHSSTRRTIAADRSANGCTPTDTAKQATRSGMLMLSRVRCGDENPHFVRVDTTRERRDRHF